MYVEEMNIVGEKEEDGAWVKLISIKQVSYEWRDVHWEAIVILSCLLQDSRKKLWEIRLVTYLAVNRPHKVRLGSHSSTCVEPVGRYGYEVLQELPYTSCVAYGTS